MDAYTGTKPVSEQHAVDAAALDAYLSRHLDGYGGPLAITQFKGGQSNPTYKLATPKASYVMRTKPGPAARLLPSAHAIDREFAVMRALGNTTVPVPAMLLLCEDESAIGRAFYVMSLVVGRVLWDPSLPGFDRAGRAAIYDEMNRVIAELHRVDPAAVGLSGYGRPGNYFERQIARWTRQYQASIGPNGPLPIEAMEALIDWLPANIPPSARDESQVSVVHGDYRLDNLIFADDEPRILAVLDWELSTLGHSLADFSYHCMAWSIEPAVFRGIAGLDLAALGIPSESEYLSRYAQRLNRDDLEAIRADWNFYLAYNLFRMAGILQGIARRVVDGTAASAEARHHAAGAQPLAELGWRFARGLRPA